MLPLREQAKAEPCTGTCKTLHFVEQVKAEFYPSACKALPLLLLCGHLKLFALRFENYSYGWWCS